MYNQAAWDIANELEAFYAQSVPAVAPEVPITFNMAEWGMRTECGTVACLAGSIMAMKNPVAFLRYIDGENVTRPWNFAAELLGLDDDQEDDMFLPTRCSHRTLPDALQMLRHYAQTGEIVWSEIE